MVKKSQKRFVLALLVGGLLLPAVGVAKEADALTQRVDRLERILQGQGLSNLITQVDQLQREVRRLNGTNEELRHQLEKMQERQREQYIDLDERIEVLAVQPPTVSNSPAPSSESADIASQAAGAELTETADSGASDSDANNGLVSIENGEAAYQAALQTLRSGQYDEAIVALASFPQQYPQSSYLPNVYYWQGEANYVVRNFDQAIIAFQMVLDKYPDSSKVPDALLKRGFSEYEIGNVDKAQTTLNQVLEDYSESSAARLAKVRLDRIQQAQ
jgi:tol-pal system protein YbgF